MNISFTEISSHDEFLVYFQLSAFLLDKIFLKQAEFYVESNDYLNFVDISKSFGQKD